ncbi:CBS domain-containing protein [Streptomyces bottropensis]|uniref:CBS domain-containing protein n=1 Tax=Streptomyces bottropensis TaxID=42235 RepID=A0ABU8B0L1_9ACTN
MTMVQMQLRSTGAAVPVLRTVADAMETAGPQACDDMTVEVALSVMASVRSGHLLVCDDDGVCTGLVTRAQLTAVRDSSVYPDRVQLRDILVDPGPFASLVTTMAEAEHAMRYRRLDALPVVDEHGNALGVLALAR